MEAGAYRSILSLPRPISKRHPRAVERRAKQFAPFAALRGFEEQIHRKEICYEEKRILSEEQKNELDMKLRMVCPGIWLKVEYFRENSCLRNMGEYLWTEGKVEFIDPSGFLFIGDTAIRIRDICEIYGEIFQELELPC